MSRIEHIFALLGEAEDPFIKAVHDLGLDNRFSFKAVPEPRGTKGGVYYVSTGLQGVNYTLRGKHIEQYQYYSGGRKPQVGYRVRDNYIMNLSPNPRSAAQKASEYTKLKIYYPGLSLGKRAKKRDVDVIKFGKYNGASVYDIAKKDPKYVAWMWWQIDGGFLSGSKFKAFARELEKAATQKEVADVIAQDKLDREEQDRLKKEQELAKVANKDRFRKIIDVLKDAGGQSDFVASMIDRLEAGEDPNDWSQRMLSVTASVYAKAHGRGNSKAYQAAENEFYDLIGYYDDGV